MCLAVPGRVESISESGDAFNRMGEVSFGGILKNVNLVYVPEAGVGDYVIVHVGFALNKIDEEEAQQVFEYLQKMDLAGEAAEPDTPGA